MLGKVKMSDLRMVKEEIKIELTREKAKQLLFLPSRSSVAEQVHLCAIAFPTLDQFKISEVPQAQKNSA